METSRQTSRQIEIDERINRDACARNCLLPHPDSESLECLKLAGIVTKSPDQHTELYRNGWRTLKEMGLHTEFTQIELPEGWSLQVDTRDHRTYHLFSTKSEMVLSCFVKVTSYDFVGYTLKN
jgi:hypothetical protein